MWTQALPPICLDWFYVRISGPPTEYYFGPPPTIQLLWPMIRLYLAKGLPPCFAIVCPGFSFGAQIVSVFNDLGRLNILGSLNSSSTVEATCSAFITENEMRSSQ
ncbi:coiled-coil domain-containing protein [Sesbania bispinosa]|nr:coiled-coil domain-containing protein [Sesbania bispinosa]